MLRYAGRRLWQMIPILLGVSLGVFAFVHAIPGDPARLLAGPDATPLDVAAVRVQLGLDRPLPVQYLYFVANALAGNFGRSFRSGEPVIRVVATHVTPTLILSMASMLLAAAMGLSVGVLQAVRRNSLSDYVSTIVSVAGISTPAFFLGLLLIFLFSVDLRWFPTGGMHGAVSLVLPAVTLAAGSAAQIARFARSSLLDVVGEDYVRTARAKGAAERRVLLHHSLRNALIPVVTLIGLQFGFLLGGAIVVETVFSWPGLGWLLIQSISFRDYPVLTAEILLFSLQFLAINLVVDLLYAALDPRVGYA
ncbi:MAG TPA: ABC transporter permease subunit [bacterium]|nr:ABC transporter permease subunit [bacterium]